MLYRRLRLPIQSEASLPNILVQDGLKAYSRRAMYSTNIQYRIPRMYLEHTQSFIDRPRTV